MPGTWTNQGTDLGQLFGPVYVLTPVEAGVDANEFLGPIFIGTLIQAVVDP